MNGSGNFDLSKAETFTIPSNITTKGRIVIDKEKNWWFNTADKGVVCITRQSQAALQIRPTFPNVKDLWVDNKHNVYFINNKAFYPSSLDNIYRLTKGQIYPVLLTDETRSISTLTTGNGKLLVTCGGVSSSGDIAFHGYWLNLKDIGISAVMPKPYFTKDYSSPEATRNSKTLIPKKTNLILKNKFKGTSYKSVLYDIRGQHFWVGYNGGVGVFRYNKETGDYVFQHNMLEGRTYALAVQDNTLWMGRSNGLYYDNIDTILRISDSKHKAKPLPSFSYNVKDLVTDDQHRLWIGTDGYGIYACEQCEKGDFKLVKGTESDIVAQLFAKNSEEIWVATANGLKRIQVKSWEPFETEVRTFNTTHGLPTRVINSVFVKDSMAYIGTREGITLLPTNIDTQDSIPPILHWTGLSINQQDTTIQLNYTLHHNDNTITIQYVGLSYKSQKNITYRYRMKGVDKDWQTTMQLERSYPQLRPGNYIFELQAIDLNGISSPIQTLQFTIQQPWWTTIWFYLLLVIFLGGLIYSIFRWRFKQLAKEEQERRAVEKRFADLELQALQAQMNPHFIFNSLSAIQNFILSSNIQSADAYLVKFARLMRSYLDASKEKYTTVDEELKLLKLYVELEQLRFKDKFDVHWLVDDEVDIYAELPTMLIQPFVENAINHGLNYKESKGLLEIIITQKDEDTICCTVKDNGVGRVAAKVIQAQAQRSHKSRGMKIIEERLETLKSVQDAFVDIQIRDLYDDATAMGTQVDILIKIMEA